jgi:hypothetical protein
MREAKLRNPMRYWLGKVRGPHSAETREKMRQSATPVAEYIRLMGHAARRGTHHSEETRAKIRAALARPEVKAKIIQSVLGKPCRHSKRTFMYNGRRFRSSYEVRVAAALDRMGIAWRYESKRFDCGLFTYCPDFYLPSQDVYWEVKGWYGPDSQRKVLALRKLYPEMQLVVFGKTCIESLEQAAARVAA